MAWFSSASVACEALAVTIIAYIRFVSHMACFGSAYAFFFFCEALAVTAPAA